MIDGVWPLIGTDPQLYTKRAADVIKDKQTGKEYIRGKLKLIHGEQSIPQLIEESEPTRWEFHYFEGETSFGRTEEYVRGIWLNTLLRK